MSFFLGLFAIVWWIILSVIVGYGAENRGRQKILYIVLSLLFSPFIGGFILLVLGPVNDEYDADSGGSYSSSSDTTDTASSAPRPYIEHGDDEPDGTLSDAWYCKHCGAQNSRNSLTCVKCGEYK